jgi:hypothetical protein
MRYNCTNIRAKVVHNLMHKRLNEVGLRERLCGFGKSGVEMGYRTGRR